MKYIRKRQEPPEFKNWKEQANSDWQPDFKNLAGKPKEILIKALMTEQGEICCYCENRLIDGKCHIEHFKPQSDPTVDPLDYANLLCSCQANLTPSEPRYCGNLKNNWFNYDGTIKPAQEDDQKAINTIEKLGLNLNKLKALRKAAIDPFLDEEIDNDELKFFVNGYLCLDDQQRYKPFWTTIKYLFSDLIE
jgi:uncharacterized protein (TIGR02646 family)